VSLLEADRAEWNSLGAEIIGGRGLTAGCSAVGGDPYKHCLPLSELFLGIFVYIRILGTNILGNVTVRPLFKVASHVGNSKVCNSV
jgi:hypothetical protein